MKLVKGKKGMILYYLVIFGFMVAMVYYLALSLYIKPAQQQGFPGEFQLRFLEEEGTIEGDKFYVEQAAKERAKEAAIKLAVMGGFKYPGERIDCGIYGTYNFWNKKDLWCKPDYKENFKAFLNQDFSQDIKNLTKEEINYDYFVKNETVVGVADRVFLKSFNSKSGALTVTTGGYGFRPSFNVKVDYSIGQYEELWQQAHELVMACRGAAELDKCIEEKIKTYNLPLRQWQEKSCDGTPQPTGEQRLFCVGEKFYRVFDKSKKSFVDQQLKYQFGLDFSQEQTVTT